MVTSMLEKLDVMHQSENQWRIQTNVELEELCKAINIGDFIKLWCLGWDIYKGRITQATPRKYVAPTYTKNDLKGDPR